MCIFGIEEKEQLVNLNKLYLDILDILKKGIIISKYRELISILPLKSNYLEIPDIDSFEMMNSNTEEEFYLIYETRKPINIKNIVTLVPLASNILNDSSYLLVKQLAETRLEHIINIPRINSKYKVSVTVSIDDIVDEDEVLWTIRLLLMVGR